MQKKEKMIFLFILLIIFAWVISIASGIPSEIYSIYREIAFGVLLITYFVFICYTFLRKWQKRIEESNSVETALAKYNYFAICTSEESVIIYCNDKFLELLGYREMVFAAGKHLSEIFNKDTYSEIEKFIGDKSISIKYLSGYIYNRFKSYVLVNIILQKFSINGKQYEHIEIFDTKFLKLLTTYVPHHLPDILNNIEDAIIFLDTNQNIRWTNTAGLKLLKNNLIENLTGRKCYEVFWNKDEFCEDCIVKETIRTGKPEETKKQLPDGRYVSIKSEPVKDDEGKLTGVIKIIRDITDQKEAEIRKKETEERLSLIAEQLPTLIWTVDENLKITYVSGTILKLINIPAENLLGKTLYEIFNTDDPEYPVIKNALYALTGESGNYQIRLMGRNYIVYYKPFINNEGKITGCVGVSQDITELINIQTELQERNEILALLGKINKIISKSGTESQLVDRLLSLFVESPHIRNAIYLFKDNDKDSILLRNSAKKDSLIENISEIRISGEDTSLNPVILCYLDMDIKKISNADTEDINKSLKSAMLRESYKSAIFLPIIIETRVYAIICLFSDRKNNFDKSDYYTNIAQDISVAVSNLLLQKRQKENEDIIRKNQMMIVKAQKYEYASRFASALAHDFNNILFSIKSYLEIIRSGINTDNNTENYLNQINVAIEKGGELTSYLMKYSTYDSLSKKVISISDLYIHMSERLFNLCRAKSVKFIRENRYSEFSLFCDADKIAEATELCARYLINRSSSESPMYLTIEPLFSDINLPDYDNNHRENMIKIELMSGTILPPELLADDIFEIKILSKNDEQPEFNLPFVNNIIRLHGGYIYSDRKKDRSGFIIILPVAYQDSDKIAFRIEMPETDKNILIVEDDPYVKEPLEIILRELKCNVLTAPDGAEALKLASRINFNIHLLITDVEMPIIDGITLAEEIHKKNCNTKIIYMSGYIKDFASKEKRLIPDSFFLQKPFQLDILKKIVTDALKLK